MADHPPTCPKHNRFIGFAGICMDCLLEAPHVTPEIAALFESAARRTTAVEAGAAALRAAAEKHDGCAICHEKPDEHEVITHVARCPCATSAGASALGLMRECREALRLANNNLRDAVFPETRAEINEALAKLDAFLGGK